MRDWLARILRHFTAAKGPRINSPTQIGSTVTTVTNVSYHVNVICPVWTAEAQRSKSAPPQYGLVDESGGG